MTSEQLKAWREGRGWSQRKLSAELEISRTSLVSYEKPGSDVPRVIALAILGIEARDGRAPGTVGGAVVA